MFLALSCEQLSNLNMPQSQSLYPSFPTMFLDEYSDFAGVLEKKGVETVLPYCLYIYMIFYMEEEGH